MEKLNDIFNLEPMQVDPTTGEILAISENISQDKEMDQEDDYQLARQTMRKLLLKSETTLDDLLELSKNSLGAPLDLSAGGEYKKAQQL